MITLITGTPGAGKTAWTVQELTRLPSQRKIYVHGIPELKIPHEPIYCQSPLCDLCQSIPNDKKHHYLEAWPEWATPGSLIVADEVQRIWTSTTTSTKTDDISRLQTHRHIGLDFWLISQNPRLLNTGVRTLVGRHIHLVSKWSGRSEYEFPECKDDTSSRGDAVVRPYKLPKQIFAKYKSSSLHTKQDHRKPLALYAFVAVIVLVGFFGYRVYDRISSRSEPITESSIKSDSENNKSIEPALNKTPLKNTYPDYKPAVPGVPSSAPAYAHLLKVESVPVLIGCVQTPEFCRCYTRQSVPTPVTNEFCHAYLKGQYFNPYRSQPDKHSLVASRSEAASDSQQGHKESSYN